MGPSTSGGAPVIARAAAAPSELDAPAFLLSQPATAASRRRALLTVLLSSVVFAALAPFATVKLAPVPAFIPVYETALVINDLITAVLLFGQHLTVRRGALNVLASGYLFTALMTLGHALSFPGLFSATGLLGAGPQSTAWIYMFWHAGFPLFVIAYAALSRPARADGLQRVARLASWAAPVIAVLLALSLIAWATAGAPWLPAVMQGNHYTGAMLGTVVSVWLCSVAALVVLWRRRPHSLLDLWLMVVLFAWLCDIALAAMLNAGRFDLGFYAGRIYGLAACSIVLLELLLENGVLHARLAQAHADELRRSRELAVARDEAQSANAAKSLFLASMSHEIRTPMNAIIGLTQLVLSSRLDERQRDYLSKVQVSSKALLMLLNDILDYSKIEAGKIVLEVEEFSPEETIENVGNLFAVKVEEAGLELFYEIGEDVPQRLLGDSLRLTQVLNNLVGNAIKFTPRGEIVIRAEVVERNGDHVMLRFGVSDTGIGLGPEERERLFQNFAQADRTIARKYGGTGLGLAICKRLVELMGGAISVESEPGQGSRFVFTARFGLPRERTERLDLHRIRGMRALVLDNQPTARLILQQTLQSWRFQVAMAAFGDDGLHKLRRADAQAPFELLLLDWKTAGAEFAREARRIVAQDGHAPLAVVVMASVHLRERVEEAMSGLPQVHVLVKPITPSRLFDAIVKLQRGESPSALPSARASDHAEQLRPLRGARVLLAEDNVVNQQVAIAFLAMGGLNVTVAGNGLEAVDWVKKERFDLVLMDMQMPEMDGVQATRIIRQLPEGRRLPIVAMTAAAMEEDKQECLAAGMNAHVGKPIDPKELVRVLLQCMPQAREVRGGAG